MIGRCHFCHGSIDTEEFGTFRRVVGWAEHRRGGGSNAIRLPEWQYDYAHRSCIDIELSGLTNQQQLPI